MHYIGVHFNNDKSNQSMSYERTYNLPQHVCNPQLVEPTYKPS